LAKLRGEAHKTTAAVRMVMIADSVANLGKPAPNGGYRCLCELGRLNHGRAIWCRIGHREARPDRTPAQQDVVAMG
jgi:hypothetical protein